MTEVMKRHFHAKRLSQEIHSSEGQRSLQSLLRSRFQARQTYWEHTHCHILLKVVLAFMFWNRPIPLS